MLGFGSMVMIASAISAATMSKKGGVVAHVPLGTRQIVEELTTASCSFLIASSPPPPGSN